ncbi:S66 peptidase family protein [Aquimarina agarivorans]|uniref:S66 peptidase family protein n=1 Tax=Aquimarina agarivorans TaxID=980584 RepID=UPI000248FD51|nr:LD-carboxypeptidase [Aquimarina agarivorans]
MQNKAKRSPNIITIPPILKKGDTIAIVSTARKILVSEINPTISYLKKLGYQILLGNTIGLEFHQFAGTDEERAEDFQQMINNPKIKAIWCARGGYGTVRIIDCIDFSPLQNFPKWVIGYSDITVLHSHLHNLNIASIHASLVFDFYKASAEAKQLLINNYKGVLSPIEFESNLHNKLGSATGIAVGGNLSVLYSLCGSPSAISTNGKILFLEDLDEYLYHIDRILQNLDRNGLFKNLSGLVIGGMTKMHDNTIPFGFNVKEQILEIAKNYNYPIVFEAPFGHIKDNRPIIFGKEITIYVQSKSVTISYSM